MKKIYIVSVLGYWGKGKTLKEAAAQCVKAGGRKSDKALAWLVLGDNEAGIDSNGRLYYNEFAKFEWTPEPVVRTSVEQIGKGFPLGSLTRLIE